MRATSLFAILRSTTIHSLSHKEPSPVSTALPARSSSKSTRATPMIRRSSPPSPTASLRSWIAAPGRSSRVERVKDGVIKVHLQWGANDRFPSQLPIAVGDVVAITNSSGDAIGVTGSVSTTLIDLKPLASPGMGIAESAGAGAMRLQKVSVVPGPRPKGATTDRLVSTNADGSHFATVEHGPTIEDCTFSNTSDDAVNVHGFYYYVIQKAGPGHYLFSPKWDVGLMGGD